MSIELWQNRILSSAEKQKRFSFFNPKTNGLGAWIEFTGIADAGEEQPGVSALKQVNFKLEGGDGHLWITDSEGAVRDPFFDRAWFYGVLMRKDVECMARFRFIDEASGGTELGTRIYTHWRFGSWKSWPKQDRNGKLHDQDIRISFGWSVNGNAYYWEPKPVETGQAQDEVKKTPKAFVPGKAAGEETQTGQEDVPVKKPKMFVPKSAGAVSETVTPVQEPVLEKKPKIFVPKNPASTVQQTAPVPVSEKKPKIFVPKNPPSAVQKTEEPGAESESKTIIPNDKTDEVPPDS